MEVLMIELNPGCETKFEQVIFRQVENNVLGKPSDWAREVE